MPKFHNGEREDWQRIIVLYLMHCFHRINLREIEVAPLHTVLQSVMNHIRRECNFTVSVTDMLIGFVYDEGNKQFPALTGVLRRLSVDLIIEEDNDGIHDIVRIIGQGLNTPERMLRRRYPSLTDSDKSFFLMICGRAVNSYKTLVNVPNRAD